ncbi:MAG: hypothetical protein MUF14_05020 [Hyphomonadaceae bacterium]|nr:hypothetical protein [Hyphomonadaceae bacterium]
MRATPYLHAAAAILCCSILATPAAAQTRCYQIQCAPVAVSPAVNPAYGVPGGIHSYAPPAGAGRSAADMDEEGAAWQRANAPAEQASPAAPAARRAQPVRPRAAAHTTRRASSMRRPGARRSAVVRAQPARRLAGRQVHRPAHPPAAVQNFNPVIDRAELYRAGSTGASTHITQWSGRGESWHSGSITTWIGPTQWSWQVAPMAGPQGPIMASQMCGWGQQSLPGGAVQPAFLCHCPAGWRPPGWHAPN